MKQNNNIEAINVLINNFDYVKNNIEALNELGVLYHKEKNI